MKKVIIPQKVGGTGSIHDIASDQYDREVKIPKGSQFAVVLAAYYGGKGYTTHKTESATIQADRRQREFSRQILGADGWTYRVEPGCPADTLTRDPDQRVAYEVEADEAVTEAAAILGRRKSPLKARKARENGRKGGRPRNVPRKEEVADG